MREAGVPPSEAAITYGDSKQMKQPSKMSSNLFPIARYSEMVGAVTVSSHLNKSTRSKLTTN